MSNLFNPVQNNTEKFKETHNTVEDLLTPGDLFLYNNTDHQLATTLVRKAVDLKLKDDPDYEVWLPLKYWKYHGANLIKRSPYICLDYIFISNKGHVMNLKHDKGDEYHGHVNETGYYVFTVRIDGEVNTCMTHRALGCLFAPVPPHLTSKAMGSLECNHIDGVKTNPGLSNIEWMTKSENVKHAVDMNLRVYEKKGEVTPTKLITKVDVQATGREYSLGATHYASKPVIGTVLIEGPYKGTQFTAAGKAQLDRYGIESATAQANGKYKQIKGCTFRFLEKGDDYPDIDTLPLELLNLIKNYNNNFKPTIVGYYHDSDKIQEFVGTAIMAAHELVSPSVYSHITSKKPGLVKGWVFIREVDGNRENTIQTLKDRYAMIMDSKPKPIIATNIATGRVTIYNSKKEFESDGFADSHVYACINGKRSEYKGHTFVR